MPTDKGTDVSQQTNHKMPDICLIKLTNHTESILTEQNITYLCRYPLRQLLHWKARQSKRS